MNSELIRNFCIIAHIDHGKSTLADRLLEISELTRPRNDFVEQRLDSMELERERGITIKAKPVKIDYMSQSGKKYQFNLIDTPGHVDFSYEVSRSLTVCEGVILVVDATQGIQAQTLANVYQALENDLHIIPVVNKIDMSAAEPDRIAQELSSSFGFMMDEIIMISAKTGDGIDLVLEAIVERIPPPEGDLNTPLRALIFDSKYDPYKGVIAFVKVVDGLVEAGDQIKIMSTGKKSEILELGCFLPNEVKLNQLYLGEVGYIATGLKDVKDVPVGDTITSGLKPASQPLQKYTSFNSMVFAGLYPVEGQDYTLLRDAIDKLKLNDSSLVSQPETSVALGFGFRCGFLGLLHMEVVQERLEREFNLNLLVTSPSVSYQVVLQDGNVVKVDNPSKLPETNSITEIREPWIKATILVPVHYMGNVIDLIKSKRGESKSIDYIQHQSETKNSGDNFVENGEFLDLSRVMLEFEMPMAEMLADFYDSLKSSTQGYGSMDYSFDGYKASKLVKLDLLVNGEKVDALSAIVHKDTAYRLGKNLVSKLKELIPRQMFEIAIQASIGSRVISRETISALRKNVLAKCYGGDVTRKRKLLQRQAEGKKRMKRVGTVDIPQEAFLSILKIDHFKHQ